MMIQSSPPTVFYLVSIQELFLSPSPNGSAELTQVAPEVDPHIPCPIDVPDKDRPVFMAAFSIRADSFLTGDIAHLGEYFGKSISGVKIPRPLDYLNMRQKKQEK
jgi:hypothetical protein